MKDYEPSKALYFIKAQGAASAHYKSRAAPPATQSHASSHAATTSVTIQAGHDQTIQPKNLVDLDILMTTPNIEVQNMRILEPDEPMDSDSASHS